MAGYEILTSSIFKSKKSILCLLPNLLLNAKIIILRISRGVCYINISKKCCQTYIVIY
jgi:hypothetical protein